MINLRQDISQPCMICGSCRRTSYNPGDIANHYCSACGYLQDQASGFVILHPTPENCEGCIRIWAMFDSPTDYPGYYVARVFYAGQSGPVAGDSIIASRELQNIRDIFLYNQLTRIPPDERDQAHIMESWL